MSRSVLQLLLILAIGAVLSLVLFGRLPAKGLWAADVSNFAHGPAFAAITLLLLAMLRRRRVGKMGVAVEYSLAILVAILIGAVVELLQATIGRDAELGDVMRDALGASAAAGFIAAMDPRIGPPGQERKLRRAGLLAGILATALLVWPLFVSGMAYLERNRSFPVIADFSTPFSDYFVTASPSVTLRRDLLPLEFSNPAGPSRGLHVEIPVTRWWGLDLHDPRPDWRGFDRIALTIANPTANPLLVHLRIYDQGRANERRNGFFTTLSVPAHASQTHRIDLQSLKYVEGAAQVDTARVHSLMLARATENRARELYLLKVWLE